MSSLEGRKIIVTAGPTIEAIDPVRFLSNRSSGKQGYLVAEVLAENGADVRLVSGPTCLPCPNGVTRIDVESARDMLAAVQSELPASVFIAVAAVSDWRPANVNKLKLGKAALRSPLALVENPDILQTVSHLPDNRPDLVIGFAAETHDLLERARDKRLRKGCDWIIANNVADDVMGGDENAAILITADQEIEWSRSTKREIAVKLAGAIDARPVTL
jgi:phosphopantothenoylcysteine decarboxylase/phosphopantothenate--cysteine ligase